MNANLIKYILLFVVLVVLQEFVFDNIQIGTLLTPYVYVLFILVLPISYPPSLVLLASFLLGLSVDFITTDMLGIHALACTFMGYFRRFVFKAVHPKEDNEQKEVSITIYNMGWRQFLLYTLILLFVHHSVYFIVESFKLLSPLYVLLHIVLSTLMSFVVILLIQLAFFRNPRSKD